MTAVETVLCTVSTTRFARLTESLWNNESGCFKLLPPRSCRKCHNCMPNDSQLGLTPSNIKIRKAVPDDLPRMIEIARHAVTAAQWNAAQYERMFSSGCLALVIEDDGRVMGFIVGRGLGEEWEIENIAVSGPARRRGLGSHLLGEFLHHAQSNGGREVFLEVRESNHAARTLYEKWAFIEAGRRKSYYQDPPEDALVLKFYFHQGS